MATEYIQKSYYEEDKSKFVDVHQSVKIAIESFLASVVFNGDFKRVIYCKKDIAFRRRVELVESDKKDTLNIRPISLQLPFACFSKESEFENDDSKGLIAPASIVGQYSLESGWTIRNLPVKSTYTATLFFGRQDELRFAHDLLYWEMVPETPHWIVHEVLYKNGSILIPCYMKITDINTSPDYAEKDWLEKSRIFPVEVKMDVYTYQICIPNVKNIISLPSRWNRYNAAANSEEELYVVEKAVMAWANSKFDLEAKPAVNPVKGPDPDKVLFTEEDRTAEQMSEDMMMNLPNDVTSDIVEGYFAESFDIQLDQFFVEDVRPDSVVINVIVNKGCYDKFGQLDIIIPGKDPIYNKDPKKRRFEVAGLYPNSTYTANLILHSDRGVVTTFNLTFTTLNTPDNQAPTADSSFSKNNILIDDPVAKEVTIDKVKANNPEPEVNDCHCCDDPQPPIRRKGNSLVGMKF